MKGYLVVLLLLLNIHLVCTQNRVIQITAANIELVLRSLGKLHLLLHNPACPHSLEYSQHFMNVKTALNLGIADCSREKQLCSLLNVTHHPTLAVLTNTTVVVLDEQQFLVQEGVVAANDAKIIASKLVNRLKTEQGWAAVILEEEGLPTLEKIPNNQERAVFYVESPSQLHANLLEMVGGKLGCWILKLDEGSLKKYYCGSGYKKEELQKYLQNFIRGRLVRHLFTTQGNSTYLHYAELQQMILDLGQRYDQCKLVYFRSSHCHHCSPLDFSKIKNALDELALNKKFIPYIYDLDTEELPSGLTLRRVPEMIEFCNSQAVPFGGIFDLSSLMRFLSRQRIVQPIREQL